MTKSERAEGGNTTKYRAGQLVRNDALGVSKSYAYKLVRQLNDEMEALGYITVRGRVDANYFRKKVCYSE